MVCETLSTRAREVSQVFVKLSRRQLIATAATGTALALAGGGAWYALREDDPKGSASRIDLLGYASLQPPPLRTDGITHLVMLTLTGGIPRNTTFEMRVFTPEGDPMQLDTAPQATLTNLITGEHTDFAIEANDGVYALTQDAIQSDGWWQVRARIGESEALFTVLLPDPNLAGFSAPPVVETDPQASAMLVGALDVLSNNASLRWWEWLAGGNGSIIMAIFSVTTPESNGLPESFENDSFLAARIPPEGGPATFREENPHTITIGTEGQRRINQGQAGPYSATNYLPIAEYATTYEGHDGVHFGITSEIGGRECQLVAFHLPGLQAAWFAFWLDIETLELRELFMISTYHYMHWVYYDLNEPFEITFPD